MPERIQSLLVVDDEPLIREVISLHFRDHYDVSTAASGKEAIEIAGQRPFAVIILDLKMEGMSGIETLQVLRRISPLSQVIILTAYQSIESAIDAVNYGAAGYLTKPVEKPQLQQVVREGFERYENSRISLSEFRRRLVRLQEDILGVLSHELLTPLNGILGFSEMLMIAGSGKDDREWAGHIHQSGKRLHTTISDLLAYVDISSDQWKEQRRNRIVRSWFRELVTDIDPAGRLRISHQRDLPRHLVLPERGLQLIVRKIVGNALRFSEDEPVGIDLAFEPARDPLQGRLRITVTDQGPGIPPGEDESLAYITEPFRQGDSGLARSAEGLGLGLAIAQALTTRLGGSLHVESKPGTGTTVIIRVGAESIADTPQ